MATALAFLDPCTNAGRPVVFDLKIPDVPQLAGSRVTMQAITPQTTGCFLFTDAVEATVRHS